jgi:phospholipid/cholesterol/gamma-HCH transport system permease protein
MDRAADFKLERGGGGSGPEALALVGDWTSDCLGKAGARLAGARKGARACELDVSQLGRIDTAGAHALVRVGLGPDTPGLQERPDLAYLVELVQASLPDEAEKPRRFDPVYAFLMRMGRGVAGLWRETYQTFAFYGELQMALLRTILDPRRLRLAPTVALMERAGLDAMPIVASTNFFVGATLAFLGADLLAQFGAQIFTVEMIGVGVLREFGVLITSVILAGRSGSSFAAELGAMKMNQEVDAIRVLGVSPYEALILPRFIAMFIMTPLLTFVAVIAGLAGGVLVTWAVLDLSPAFFFQRLLDNVGLKHFWIGMVKAPVFAMVIASIGCRQGLEVGGDVEQLGRRVTSAVVEALFAIIILDACFALLFMELGT